MKLQLVRGPKIGTGITVEEHTFFLRHFQDARVRPPELAEPFGKALENYITFAAYFKNQIQESSSGSPRLDCRTTNALPIVDVKE